MYRVDAMGKYRDIFSNSAWYVCEESVLCIVLMLWVNTAIYFLTVHGMFVKRVCCVSC